MGKLVLKDCAIEVDGVDLSARASKVTITSSKNLVESTAFGAAYRESEIGIGDASMAVTFQQDYDAGSVNATLWPLHVAGSKFRVRVTPTGAAVSATNPAYFLAEALLPEYTPLNGSVGDLSTIDVTFQNGGQRGVEVATA